jgi:hypothetical protein
VSLKFCFKVESHCMSLSSVSCYSFLSTWTLKELMKNTAWNLEAWQQINELVGQYFVHSSGPFGVSHSDCKAQNSRRYLGSLEPQLFERFYTAIHTLSIFLKCIFLSCRCLVILTGNPFPSGRCCFTSIDITSHGPGQQLMTRQPVIVLCCRI